MGLSLAQIRTYVRAYPDIDTEDLPDTVLDIIIQSEFNRIAGSQRTWDFYRVVYSLNVVTDTQTYALDSIGVAPLADIAYVVGDNDRFLNPVAHASALNRYQGATSGGEPTAWSQWYGDLYLWPVPNTTYTFSVYGYREPLDWVAEGAGAEPDLPDEFHHALADRVLSSVYVQQDDPELGAVVKQRADEAISAISTKHLGTGPASPVIMNGGRNQVQRQELVPPRFSWEW